MEECDQRSVEGSDIAFARVIKGEEPEEQIVRVSPGIQCQRLGSADQSHGRLGVVGWTRTQVRTRPRTLQVQVVSDWDRPRPWLAAPSQAAFSLVTLPVGPGHYCLGPGACLGLPAESCSAAARPARPGA